MIWARPILARLAEAQSSEGKAYKSSNDEIPYNGMGLAAPS